LKATGSDPSGRAKYGFPFASSRIAVACAQGTFAYLEMTCLFRREETRVCFASRTKT
jgi:hypothetical protein